MNWTILPNFSENEIWKIQKICKFLILLIYFFIFFSELQIFFIVTILIILSFSELFIISITLQITERFRLY